MKYFGFICLFFLFTTGTQAQSSGKKGKGNYYVEIKDSTFAGTKPQRGATLTGYYTNDSIEKVVTWFGFNYGDLTRKYFYWKNNLILIVEEQRLYNTTTQLPADPSAVKPNFTGRYIFVDGKLTDMKETGTYSFNDTPSDKASQEAMFLSFSDKYMKLLNEARAKKKNRIKWEEKES